MVHLSCGDAEATLSLVGAEPLSWRVGGRELIWHGDPAHWGWHAPILFPVVGRTRNDRIRVEGRDHPMSQHGFARHSRFTLIGQNAGEAALRLTGDDVAGADFPFRFGLDVRATLSADRLSVAFEVSNPGEGVLPYGLGFHPAFPWPFDAQDAGAQEDYVVAFESGEDPQVPVITPDGLIGRARRPAPVEGRILRLRPELFAANAFVFLNARSRTLRFAAPSGAAIAMTTEGFPHWALWTRPGAPFLSLEAWTGHADPEDFWGEFADKPATVRLGPGEQRRHAVHLTWQSR